MKRKGDRETSLKEKFMTFILFSLRLFDPLKHSFITEKLRIRQQDRIVLRLCDL